MGCFGVLMLLFLLLFGFFLWLGKFVDCGGLFDLLLSFLVKWEWLFEVMVVSSEVDVFFFFSVVVSLVVFVWCSVVFWLICLSRLMVFDMCFFLFW